MTAVAIQPVGVGAGVPHGLCTTCTNMPGCGFYRSPNPVMHCEEFTLDDAPTSPVSRSRRSLISAPSEHDHGIFQGICVNCDERARCTLRPPDRAVWHCEEYR